MHTGSTLRPRSTEDKAAMVAAIVASPAAQRAIMTERRAASCAVPFSKADANQRSEKPPQLESESLALKE